MAEERLIDTDKDKKYRIRKNADGEDELYIDESAEEQDVEEVTFTVEDGYENNLADCTEEESLSEEKKELIDEEVALLLQNARRECEESRYATAADCLEKAIELNPENGEIYALELVAYTRSFTDYSQIKEALAYVEEVKRYTSPQTKEELFVKAKATLEENINSLKSTVDTLSEENERQKAVRAKKFVADRSKKAVLMSVVFAVFVALSAAAIYCYLNIHSVRTNEYLIAAIALTAVAFVALVVSGIVLRKLLTACRRVRLNRKNTATELGRKLLAHQADLNAFIAIYEALKG